MTTLSICIPTFNRSNSLGNCLNSICISNDLANLKDIEVCISDNCSTDNTREIVKKFEDKIKIKYFKNEKNLGFARNALRAVSLANGKFSWLIGDDDLVIPKALSKINSLIKNFPLVDYFFINSYHLNKDYLKDFNYPFNTNNLKFNEMNKISKLEINKVVNFWEVIDPSVSWEFLIGIYLSIFNTKKWRKSSENINQEKINDTKVWSNFENTCLHPIIIGSAFKNSKSYICTDPLSVNLIGEREWGDLYEFVEIVRIPELLDYYRKQGMPLLNYLKCKNFL